MLSNKRITTLTLMSAIALSGALTLSACSKSSQANEAGVDPAPNSMAGNQTTGEYADQAGVMHQGDPDTQVDPYTGSTVDENYAGHHQIAPEQTVGERLDMAKENVKSAGRQAGHELKQAGQAAGGNLKEAGRQTKAAGQRMKNEVKEEFDDDNSNNY